LHNFAIFHLETLFELTITTKDLGPLGEIKKPAATQDLMVVMAARPVRAPLTDAVARPQVEMLALALSLAHDSRAR
jgi:hypothetical protein